MKILAKNVARELRKNQTESEGIFWEVVRNRKLFGKKISTSASCTTKIHGKETFFHRRFLLCREKIIIEIDGKIHENQVEYDNLRDHLIKEMGIRVIRIKNEDLIDIPSLIEKLKPELL